MRKLLLLSLFVAAGCTMSRMSFPGLFDKGAVRVVGHVDRIEGACAVVVFEKLYHEKHKFDLNQPVYFLLKTERQRKKFKPRAEVFITYYVNEAPDEPPLLNARGGRAMRRVINLELMTIGSRNHVDASFLNKRLVVVLGGPTYSYSWENVRKCSTFKDFYILEK